MLKKRDAAIVAAGGGSLLAGALYCYSQYVEPFQLELTTPEVFCPRLPKALEGIRVLLLADPHVDEWSKREEMVLDMLRDLPVKPDIVVWGGDYLYQFGRTEGGLRLVREGQALLAGIPSYGLLGNAEHKLSPEKTREFSEQMEALGVRMMNNCWETLTLRGTPITVAGVDDPYYGFDDIDAALKEAPSDQFTLFLAHSPQIVYRAAHAGVDLMLSGHTHGGQVRFPLVGALKAQNPLGRKLDRGLFDRERLYPIVGDRAVPDDFRLYITQGIGTAPSWRFYWLRPRLLCRPEITLMTLRSG